MSLRLSPSDGEQEPVPSLSTYVITNYVTLPGAAVILYDHAITISAEAPLIWGSKRTAVTVLYALNRVFSLLYAVGLFLSLPLWTTISSAIGTDVVYQVPQLLLLVLWAVFSALRVYAVGRRAWRAATAVFALSLVPFVLNVYVLAYTKFVKVEISWFSSASPPMDESVAVAVAIRGSAIVSDAAVLLSTWVGVYMLGGSDGMHGYGRTPLVTMLLRDGTAYFGALLVLNLALLVVYSHWGSEMELGPVVTGLSSVIFSRFLLNLRRVGAEHERMQTLPPETLPAFHHPRVSTRHRSFFGSMGEDLDFSFAVEGQGDEDGDTDGEEDVESFELAEMSKHHREPTVHEGPAENSEDLDGLHPVARSICV